MIDLANETVVTLSQATQYVPKRRGKGASPSGVWRWIVNGHRGVKLEGLRTPAGWFTSVEALGRFFAALARRQASPSRSRERKRLEALARLEAAGVQVR